MGANTAWISIPALVAGCWTVCGEEGSNDTAVYDRQRLLKLIELKATETSDTDDFRMVTGTLNASGKAVGDVYAPVSADTVLDDRERLRINNTGLTRIPVYEGSDRRLVWSLLDVKDIAKLKTGTKRTVGEVCGRRGIRFVLKDTPLIPLLREFNKGNYHLAMVTSVQTTDNNWAYELLGLCALEDTVETITNTDIKDEHDKPLYLSQDTWARNVVSVLRNLYFETCKCPEASVQLRLATILFLTESLDAFSTSTMPQEIVEMLLREHVVKYTDRLGPLYTKEYFTLLMRGQLAVEEVGQEEQKFDVEPFHHFGIDSLNMDDGHTYTLDSDAQEVSSLTGTQRSDSGRPFVPDCTVTADGSAIVLRLTADQYRKYRLMAESDY